ncbi:MAG: hypothetical protein CSA54_04445 [Gammaproteobacteria bacterium]|nr:MAG: hypothetical protein CSA54_04445 [Gammaproteobacteria bacterium]
MHFFNRQVVLRITALLCCIALYLPALCHAEDATAQAPLLIITDSQEQVHYRGILDSLHNRLGNDFSIRVLNAGQRAEITRHLSKQPTGCVLSIGPLSFDAISQEPPAHCRLALLISKYRFARAPARYRQQSSAIFINQPLERITRVARQTLKRARQAAIIISRDWPETLSFGSSDMDLYIKRIKPGDSVVDTFRQAGRHADFIIALPDDEVYNRSNIKSILLTTYKAKVPLIGYSEALSRAGALISVYTPPQYLGKQAAEWLISNQQQPASQAASAFAAPPRYYRVAINAKVAHSLGTALRDDAVLAQGIREDSDE